MEGSHVGESATAPAPPSDGDGDGVVHGGVAVTGSGGEEAGDRAAFSSVVPSVISTLVGYLDPWGMGRLEATSNTMRAAIGSSQQHYADLATRAFPTDARFLFPRHGVTAAPHPYPTHWSPKRTFVHWLGVQRGWNGEGAGPAITSRRISSGSVFSVCGLGNGAFITSGADGSVRVVAPRYSALAEGGKASVSTQLEVSHEFTAQAVGMLATSVDMTTRTLVTGAFDGQATLWRLAIDEAVDVDHLPVRRLKEMLTSGGVPFDDCREKSELIRRVKVYLRTPVATKLASLTGHTAPVIASSHFGSLIVTGSNDGTTRVWKAEGGTLVQTWEDAHAGVDSVWYDPRTSRAFAGNKGGEVHVYDVTSGSCTHALACGDCWVWCIKTGSSYTGTLPPLADGMRTVEPGGSKADGVGMGATASPSARVRVAADSRGSVACDGASFATGDVVLVGTTSGTVHAFDLRSRACVRSVSAAQDAAMPILWGMAESRPIAGLAPMFEHHRFVTASFDAHVRVWDMRTWRTVHDVELPSHDPCTRVDVHHDGIMVGGREGTVSWIDMDPARGEVVGLDEVAAGVSGGAGRW